MLRLLKKIFPERWIVEGVVFGILGMYSFFMTMGQMYPLPGGRVMPWYLLAFVAVIGGGIMPLVAYWIARGLAALPSRNKIWGSDERKKGDGAD